MADLTTNLTEDPVARPSRRNVLVGTAWAVPVVMGVGATPAMAASGDSLAITSVSVSPAATGGASVPSRTINMATPATATVTVSGTATAGVQVYVSTGSYNSTAVTATGGNWSVTIPATQVSTWSDGTHTFSATVVAGNKPTATSTLTVIKDTQKPSITGTPAVTYFGTRSPKRVTFSGTMSEPGRVTVTWRTYSTTVTTSGPTNAWSGEWSGMSNNDSGTFSAAPVDSAGNPGTSYTRTFTA